MHEEHFTRNAHCAGCTIGCEKIMTTKDDKPQKTGRMEYESAFALGSLLGISDPNDVIRLSVYCDETGMDSVSAGGTLAWAMECFERGLLTLEDTGGIELRFGNADAAMRVLEMIAHRQGIGDLLADGSRMASQRLGQGSGAWAMHVKGLEMPGYEPRSLQTMALALAVSTRGACHNRSSAYEADFSAAVDRLAADDSRGRITMEGEDFSALLDSMIWCKFLRKAFNDFYGESAQIYRMVTGFEITADELRQAGERINNLKKLFNIREGWTRHDDTLPSRALTERLPTGIATGAGLTAADLDMMISSYYKARGWNDDGTIPPEKLAALELRDFVAVIDTLGAEKNVLQ
jgi:aldehyde:ferredoxin oxidoreductase